MPHHDVLLRLTCCLSLLPTVTHAEWMPNGIPLCHRDANQYVPFMASDGAGGFVVVWQDFRNGDGDVYAQKVNASGDVQWTADGVAVCTAAAAQSANGLVADGTGGTILVWVDARSGSYDLYAQRLGTNGVPQWSANGVAVCTATGNQSITFRGCIAADGAGGAIVVWTDLRTAPARIYAQRINGQGVAQWTANGVPVSPSATGAQSDAVVVPDGASGALIAWHDSRAQIGGNDIYAQRLNAAGTAQWMNGADNGIAVCAVAQSQDRPVIVSDRAGGFIAAWEDARDFGRDIFAQRVNAAGARLWTANGVGVATGSGLQNQVRIAEDGAGGVLLVWQDGRNTAVDYDVYAQRLNSSGTPLWAANGVPVCVNALRQEEPKIVTDGAGGAFVSWFDQRNALNWDTYSQHVNSSGKPLWTLDGVATSATDGDQVVTTLVPDGTGGALCAWSDSRGGDYDVYAQFVTGSPNAVAIMSFEATTHDGVVELRSRFRSDLGVQGVNIYRGAKGGPLAPIARVGAGEGREFGYEDATVQPGEWYDYQIGVSDADGEFFSPIVSVRVDEMTLRLEQNRPNPFNPSTTIRFVIPKQGHVLLAIYDANGAIVRTILDADNPHGAHEVQWDGRDDRGTVVGSGVYFYRLTAESRSETKKMILVK